MQTQELAELLCVEMKDLETYHEWYATVLQTLLTVHKEKLERSALWAAVRAEGKPLRLVDLVKSCILLDSDGLADTALQDMLISRRCAQTGTARGPAY